MSKSNACLKVIAGVYFCLSSWGFANASLVWPDPKTAFCSATTSWPCGSESVAGFIWYFCWAFGLTLIGTGIYQHCRCCKGGCKCCGKGDKSCCKPEAEASAPSKAG